MPIDSPTELELILFRCGPLTCALPIAAVKEISRCEQVTRAPHAKPHVLGALSLRGNVVTVIDLCCILQASHGKRGSSAVIVQHQCELVALAVDEVLDVISTSARQTVAAPSNFKRHGSGAFGRVLHRDDGLVYLLDIDQILAT